MQKFVKFNDVAESYILIVRLQHTFTNFMVLSPDDQLERYRQNISKIHFTLSEKLWPAYLKLWPEMYEKEALGKTRDLSSVKKLFSPVF